MFIDNIKNDRQGLRCWRVGIVWYLVAVLTAPHLVAAASLVLLTSSPAYLPGIVTASEKVTLIVFGLIAGTLVGIFEEIGWTGFAIPRLRKRYGILATGIVLGLVWGLWHLPLFASSARTSQRIPPVFTLAVMLFSYLPAFRVLVVWVYDRTQSLLVAMLMLLGQTATALVLAIPVSADQTVVHDLLYAACLWMFVDGRQWRPQLVRNRGKQRRLELVALFENLGAGFHFTQAGTFEGQRSLACKGL